MLLQFLKSVTLWLCGICPIHGEPLDTCRACALTRTVRSAGGSLWN